MTDSWTKGGLMGYILAGNSHKAVDALLKMTPVEAALTAFKLYDQLPDISKTQLLEALEKGTKSFFVVDISNNVMFQYDNLLDATKRAEQDIRVLLVVPGGTK